MRRASEIQFFPKKNNFQKKQPTGQLCSQCHELGHNKLSPKCSVNIANKQSEALAAITAARSNNLNSLDPRNNYNYAQQFNPSPAKKGEFNSIADTNILNDSISIDESFSPFCSQQLHRSDTS